MKKKDEISFKQQLLQLEKTKIKAFIDSSRNAVKNDEDMYFLKSIHPYFGNMTPLQKLRVRTQIQEVIMRELSVPSSQPMNNNLTILTNIQYLYNPCNHHNPFHSNPFIILCNH